MIWNRFKKGFEVIIQKSLPFLDNLIQLKVKNRAISDNFDIDIYLYSRQDNFAYMRWIQKPEGPFSYLKQKTLLVLRNLVNPLNNKWIRRSNFFSRYLINSVFNFYLKFHIRFSSCIFHYLHCAFPLSSHVLRPSFSTIPFSSFILHQCAFHHLFFYHASFVFHRALVAIHFPSCIFTAFINHH